LSGGIDFFAFGATLPHHAAQPLEGGKFALFAVGLILVMSGFLAAVPCAFPGAEGCSGYIGVV
jgi:hypothetical protein